MLKSTALILSAGFALHAAHAFAAFTPPIGLTPGSQYQLVFVTSGTTRADSKDISYYNAFVTAAAALNPSLPQAALWSAVGSVDGSGASHEAIGNAPSGIFVGNIPVYNTHGIEVSDGSGYGIYGPLSFSGAPLLNPIEFDQFGNPSTAGGLNNFVWTGSTDTGQVDTYALGGSEVMTGDAYAVTGYLKSGAQRLQEEPYPLYALSSPITVPVPEPSGLIMLGIGALAAAGMAIDRLTQTENCRLS